MPENQPGSWALIGLTEGAIPFAAVDPLRVIPSIMVGAAHSVQLWQPFSAFPIPSLHRLLLAVSRLISRCIYVLCHVVGVVVTALAGKCPQEKIVVPKRIEEAAHIFVRMDCIQKVSNSARIEAGYENRFTSFHIRTGISEWYRPFQYFRDPISLS